MTELEWDQECAKAHAEYGNVFECLKVAEALPNIFLLHQQPIWGQLSPRFFDIQYALESGFAVGDPLPKWQGPGDTGHKCFVRCTVRLLKGLEADAGRVLQWLGNGVMPNQKDMLAAQIYDEWPAFEALLRLYAIR